MDVNCHICKKIFYVQNHRIKRGTKKFYCSKECKIKKGTICLLCLKEIDRSKKLGYKEHCLSCYGKYYDKLYPEKHNETKRKMRERQRIKKGIPLDLPLLKNPKGSGSINDSGYKRIVIHGHPNASKRGRITEHAVIMVEHLGRPLTKKETIHHKNGIRNDNRIENLELWSSSHPSGQRVIDKLKFYKEFLEQYGCKVDVSGLTIFDIMDDYKATISS